MPLESPVGRFRRQGLLSFAGALSLAATAAGVGCSNDSGTQNPATGGGTQGGASGTGGSNSSGGSTGTGGSPGTGGASGMAGSSGASGAGGTLNCTNVTECGGDVVGTWNVSSSCLKLSGAMDTSGISLGCTSVPVNGSLQTTGTLALNANGTYTDNTTTTGSVTFPLAPECLSVSMVPVTCDRIGSIFVASGWKGGSCTPANDGCNCSLTTEQHGGMGAVVSFTEPMGSYTTANNTLTCSNVSYKYCAAAGDTLTVTPQMSSLTGTITLQREGTGGTGGMGGGSGAGPTGGTDTGGASGMGGSGGNSGMGGSAGTSGMGGKGGSAGSGGGAGKGGSGGTGGTPGGTGPCDIYATGNTPCIAAHSTVRALFGAYTGNLYQVKRADGTTKDIPVKSAGGFADSSQQETFCMGSTCTIWRVYDQTTHGNFIEAETPQSTVGGHSGMTAANAAAESLMVSGNKVYSLYTRPSQAYWKDATTTGAPGGANPQGVYMVTSGTHFNGGCCYDYGTAQVSRTYEGGPTMDSVYFGSCTIWGTGAGSGPWVMSDQEDGMLSGANTMKNNNLPSMPYKYVTAIEKNNGRTEYALRGANATTGNLTTFYKGAGRGTMKKGGAIVLGSGGDCCYSNNNASEGTFYEGAIVAGYPSDATEDAIQANIVSAGYGK